MYQQSGGFMLSSYLGFTSLTTNPLALHGGVTASVGKGGWMGVIYLEFCEASDMVPHNILTSASRWADPVPYRRC